MLKDIGVEFDAGDYIDALDRLAKATGVPAHEINEEVALKFLEGVKMQTPVKTGFARAGWRLKKYQSGDIEVYNCVNYILELEFDKSKQTRGQGIVRYVMPRIVNALKEKLNKLVNGALRGA